MKALNSTPARRKTSGLADNIKTIVYAILIALGIRTVAFEPFSIPSGSMIPTLLVGDYLFVSKYSYGYSRYSLPFGLPLIPGPGRIFEHAPRRGDVAVFKFPANPSIDYIKRVIGLPGDKIQMRDGRLYINGTIVPREEVKDTSYTDRDQAAVPVHEYIETLPGGARHPIFEITDRGRWDDTLEYTVPAGTYFMMGDNRDNSSDSRVPPREGGVGFVPVENFVGRAEFIFFSFSSDDGAALWEFWKWPAAIRYGRLFKGVR